MSWITINIDRIRIRPQSVIRIILWFSVLGLVGVAAGVVPQEEASGYYQIGMAAVLAWAFLDYAIPAAWIMYEQWADRKDTSAI